MTIYVFLYNVVAIKATMENLACVDNNKFILIGSDYCLKQLSEKNKDFFDEIHLVSRNFHQIDLKEVEPILAELVKVHGSNNIRLLTNEDSTQIVCAQLREKYNIVGSNTAQVLPFVNKIISKNRLAGKVRTPRFISFNKLAYQSNPEKYLEQVITDIGFPMFIKPIDLVSSIGTHYIPDSNVLRTVMTEIAGEPWEFEIDEFIEGNLFHCDVVVRNNTIEFFMAAKYAYPLARFSKGSPMGSIPVNDQQLFSELKQFSLDALNCLGMFTSAFHLEVFQDKQSGELIFLEAAARTPGALVPEMYEIIFDQNLEELHYLVQMNSDCHLTIRKTSNQAGWITFPQTEGVLLNIKKPDISINNTITNFVKSGDELKQAKSLLDSSCSVVFWDKSFQKINEAFEFLKAYNPLIFK